MRIHRVVLGAWLLCAGVIPVVSAVDLSLVPAGVSAGGAFAGNEATISPGDSVALDVYVSNWAGESLRGIQVAINSDSFTTGSGGSLALANLDQSPADGQCDAAVESMCPGCATNLLNALDLTKGIYLDTCRRRCNSASASACNVTDPFTCPGEGGVAACMLGFAEAFGQMSPLVGNVVSAVNSQNVSMVLTGFTHGIGVEDDGQAHYVGTYVLRVSDDAVGPFTISLRPESFPQQWEHECLFRDAWAQPLTQTTNLGQAVIHTRCPATACDDANMCTVDRCEDGGCIHTPLRYGDVNEDDFKNAEDVLCLLDDFGGNPYSTACKRGGSFSSDAPVALQEKDIAPCPDAFDPLNLGDGFVNLDDVLAAKNAFEGLLPPESQDCP